MPQVEANIAAMQIAGLGEVAAKYVNGLKQEIERQKVLLNSTIGPQDGKQTSDEALEAPGGKMKIRRIMVRMSHGGTAVFIMPTPITPSDLRLFKKAMRDLERRLNPMRSMRGR